MSISPGFTAVGSLSSCSEYHQAAVWAEGSLACWSGRHTSHRLRRWQAAVFDGDLDRGLIPREGGGVTTPPAKRTASARVRAAEVHQP